MAVPRIQVYSNLTAHPKIYNLAEELNLPRSKVAGNAAAAGMMVGLWSWAAVNAPDGDLTGCPARALADASGWRGKPEVLFDALISCGWIDEINGRYFLHDWEEYAALYIDQIDSQKEKTRERVRALRARRNSERQKENNSQNNGNSSDTDCNVTGNAGCNVTETQCNAPTIPNLYSSSSSSLSSETVQAAEAESSSGVMNSVTKDNGDSSKSQITAQAADLCAYFEDNCHTTCSNALLTSFAKSLEEGAEPEMVRAVIEDAALGNADKPALYAAKILKNLRDERVQNLSDYRARSERHRDKRKGKSSPEQRADSNPQIDEYEQNWLEDVKKHGKQKEVDRNDAEGK